ncbi:MAG: FlgO family outer membrane protein [Syntrophobacterales bacterium]|nr:FlgO family outer membrane protein [Syntrophobacterales bacterium]
MKRSLLIVFIIFFSFFVLLVQKAKADCEEAKKIFVQSLNEGDVDRRIQLLVKAVTDCPDFAEAYNNLGLAFEEKNLFNEALDAYRKASEIKPNFPHPFAGMGDIYRKQEKYGEAIKMYRRFLDLSASKEVRQRYPDVANYVSIIEKNLKACEAKLNPQEKQKVESEELEDSDQIVTAKAITEALTKKTRGISAGSSIPIKIHFATNSAAISPKSHRQLEEIARALNEPVLASSKILIEGHTDNVGSDAYNLELSSKRAESVKSYLVEKFGIEANRLETRGVGSSRPVASNDTSWGRAQNRRVELVNLGSISQEISREASRGQVALTTNEKTVEPPKESIKLAILELDFLDRSGRQDPMGRMISEFLTTASVDSGRFSIVERSLLEKVMKELELGQSGIVEEGKAREIGKMVGAGAILTGSVSRLGNTMRIDIRLIDVESGKIMAAANEITEGDLQSLSRACNILVQRIIAKLK